MNAGVWNLNGIKGRKLITIWLLQSNYGSVNATILFLLFRCYCHNMFQSYNHHQATGYVISLPGYLTTYTAG
jgi:hypothetical protein